jgi:FMN phosphatase YigB (HAD superfamily)
MSMFQPGHANIETGILTLLDVDGTLSDTATHMTGLNDRLSRAFPQIGEALPNIGEQRKAFRREYGQLSFTQQDQIWRSLHPGAGSMHSQLNVYRAFAPDVFDAQTTEEVRDWLADPNNFGSAEYPDVAPMLDGLQRIGSQVILFTLGSETFWQPTKLDSSPLLCDYPRHIPSALPDEGKGAVIARSYDHNRGKYQLPVDNGGPFEANAVVLVDDSRHNMNLPASALGILIDRNDMYSNWDHPDNVTVINSLEYVPELVAEYAALRQQDES